MVISLVAAQTSYACICFGAPEFCKPLNPTPTTPTTPVTPPAPTTPEPEQPVVITTPPPTVVAASSVKTTVVDPAPVAAAELPQTGISESLLSGFVGLGAITYAGVAFIRSRQ